MAKGISINFLADVRDFLKGTKNVEDSLDDVADSLDEVVKDGDKAAGKMEDSFREIAKASKKAGDDVGDNFKKGAKEAEDASQVLKKEAIANLSEVTSSFDGSITSLADGIQGTLGGIVQDLGPLGIAAGAAGAAGVGLLVSAYEASQEQAQKAKERVQELAAALIDEVGDGTVPLDYIVDQLKEIATGSDDARKKFKDIKREAENLGLEIGALATAYAGGTEEIDKQLAKLDDLLQAERDNQQAVLEGTKAFDENSAQKITDIIGQQGALRKVKEEIDLANEAEQAWLNSGGAEMLAKQDAITGINDAYDEVVGSVTDFINEESGILDVQAYLDAIDARATALDEYQTKLAESGLSTEQKAALNDMGVDAAAAWLKGYESATPEQQRKLKRSLTEASKENSGVARGEIEKAFQKPIEAKVKVDADISRAQRDLDNLIQARTAVIRVDFQDRYGKKVY